MEQEKKEALQQQSEESGLQQVPPQPETEAAKESGKGPLHIVLTKKLLYTVLAAVGGIALVLVLVFTLIIPLGKRIRSSNEISRAVTSYQKGEMSFTEAEKQIREYYFVTAQSNQAFRAYEKLCELRFDKTEQDYHAGTISYEAAKGELKKFVSARVGAVATEAKSRRDALIAEHAFAQSAALAEQGEFRQAIELLAEVKEGNEAYEKAQQQKKGYLDQWAERISGQMDSLRASGDYEEALTQISDYRAFSADDRFDALAQTLSEEKLEYDKEHQLVTAEITSAEIDGWLVNECKYNLTNHSDRVLKKAEAVILIFDENGDPIDSVWGGYIKDENGKEIINAETDTVKEVALQPGETEEQRALTDNDAVKYKICVRSAEFEDGETWENPYFKVWLSEEKDRY